MTELSHEELPPLPSLPDPVPSHMYNMSTKEVYQVITALQRNLEDSDVSSRAAEGEMEAIQALVSEPEVLLAVVSVLHQSGQLKRPVGADGEYEVIFPPKPTIPALPAGLTSWLGQH